MITVGTRTRQVARQFAKFCLVGGSGVAVNTLVFVVLAEGLRLHALLTPPLPLEEALLLPQAVAWEVALISNFLWNSLWTFRAHPFELRRLGRFNVVSLGGLAITSLVFFILTKHYALPPILANVVGIGVATVWNFGLNVLWTWETPV